MASNISINSIDSGVFFVEQLSSEPSPQRYNSPIFLIPAEQSGIHTREIPTIFSVTSPEPDIVTLDDDSNGQTFPYGFGAQQPTVPPSLNDLNLPPNLFNILAMMTLVQQNPTQHDDNYGPQSPEPSEPSPLSTPPKKLSKIDGRETPHTRSDDNTFYSEYEPRRVHWNSLLDESILSEGEPRGNYLLPSQSLPSPPHKMKRKLEMGVSFPKTEGVSQHVSKACGQMIPPTKDIPGPSTKDWNSTNSQTIFIHANKLIILFIIL